MLDIFISSFTLLLFIVLIFNLTGAKTRNLFLSYFIIIVLNTFVYSIFYEELKDSLANEIFRLFFSDVYYGPVLFLYLLSVLKEKITIKLVLLHWIFPFVLALSYFLLQTVFQSYYVGFRMFLAPMSGIITLIYLYLGFKKVRQLKSERVAKFRYRCFYYSVNIYFILDSIFLFLSLFYFSNNDPGTLTNQISSFYYQHIQLPIFYLFCLVLFLYGLTESVWLKRFMLVETIDKQVSISDFEIERIEEDIQKNNREMDFCLTGRDYCNEIGISKEMLQQFLKLKGFDSFIAFLNARRVENFKRNLKLPKYKNYNIEGIALESGFKSKSTFFRVFKEQEGVTPTQYMKNHQQG